MSPDCPPDSGPSPRASSESGASMAPAWRRPPLRAAAAVAAAGLAVGRVAREREAGCFFRAVFAREGDFGFERDFARPRVARVRETVLRRAVLRDAVFRAGFFLAGRFAARAFFDRAGFFFDRAGFLAMGGLYIPRRRTDRGASVDRALDWRGRGGVAEWFKAAVLKTAVPGRVPGVQIPPPPPSKSCRPRERASRSLATSGKT